MRPRLGLKKGGFSHGSRGHNPIKPKFEHTAKYKRMTDYGDDWPAAQAECLRLANHTCARCGEPGNNAHHIIPRSRGGRNVQTNLQCLCDTCHNSKHKHLQKRKP